MSLFLQHLRLPFGPEVLEGHEGEVPAQAQAGEAVADVVQAQVLAEEIAVAVAAAVPEGASDKRNGHSSWRPWEMPLPHLFKLPVCVLQEHGDT